MEIQGVRFSCLRRRMVPPIVNGYIVRGSATLFFYLVPVATVL